MSKASHASPPTTTRETGFCWIECSDGGMVPMGRNRLDVVLQKMPVLCFLLLGHPQMKAKTFQDRDGMKVLKIPPDLNVSQQEFLAVIHAVLGLTRFPHPEMDATQRQRLLHTISILGGCEDLEQNLRHGGYTSLPRKPSQDSYNEYEWQILRTPQTQGVAATDATEMAAQGFTFCALESDLVDHSMVILYYRKPKQQQQQQQ